MKTHTKRNRQTDRNDHGAILVLAAILLPILLGCAGLVIDIGVLMVAARQSQNAADAAAMAGAVDLLLGRPTATARTTAQSYVQTLHELNASQVTVNIPPTTGPYAGTDGYVEVFVQTPTRTSFIQVLGVNRDQFVRSAAIAGVRPRPAIPALLALNPAARPGLAVGGNGSLVVNGNITVNSNGGGVDQNGNPIGNGNTGTAASVSNNGTVQAPDIRIVGGVNNPANFEPYDPAVTTSPLRTGQLPLEDPLEYLPPPTIATGANPTVYPAVSVTGNTTVTLTPGIYPSIQIQSGTVVFEPGIYIIRGGDLVVTEDRVTANGVMFYITGSDYDVTSGLPDSGDIGAVPPDSGGASFGGVTINASMQFHGLNDPSSPFHGMLFYQRRLNTNSFSLAGNSAAGNLSGTFYSKWASLDISGQGTYGSQIIAADVKLTGNGTVTIDPGNDPVVAADMVALVQ